MRKITSRRQQMRLYCIVLLYCCLLSFLIFSLLATSTINPNLNLNTPKFRRQGLRKKSSELISAVNVTVSVCIYEAVLCYCTTSATVWYLYKSISPSLKIDQLATCNRTAFGCLFTKVIGIIYIPDALHDTQQKVSRHSKQIYFCGTYCKKRLSKSNAVQGKDDS